jgi:hypothetical protein
MKELNTILEDALTELQQNPAPQPNPQPQAQQGQATPTPQPAQPQAQAQQPQVAKPTATRADQGEAALGIIKTALGNAFAGFDKLSTTAKPKIATYMLQQIMAKLDPTSLQTFKTDFMNLMKAK